MSPKQRSMILGGLVVGVLSTSYLGIINIACCAGVIIGAMVSVWHFTDTQQLTIEAGDGALIGAGAGAIGALVAVVLDVSLVQPLGLGLEQAMMDFLQGVDLPEETRQQFEAQAQQGTSPSQIGISLVFGLIINAIFGAIGGAIGAAVFQKGEDEETSASSPATDDF